MVLLRAIFCGMKLAFNVLKAGFSKLTESPLTLWAGFAGLTSLSGSFFMERAAELIINKVIPRVIFASGVHSLSELVELNPIAAWVVSMASLDVLGRWLLQLLALWAAYRVALLGKMAITAVLHITP